MGPEEQRKKAKGPAGLLIYSLPRIYDSRLLQARDSPVLSARGPKDTSLGK